MKNRLSDLNNHLFAQLERLGDEGLSDEKLELEVKRGTAVAAVADQVIRGAALRVQAAKIASDHGIDPSTYLRSLEVEPEKRVEGDDRQNPRIAQ